MRKIIIIEDDIYLREELVNTFVKKGYSVSSISSFECAQHGRNLTGESPECGLVVPST